MKKFLLVCSGLIWLSCMAQAQIDPAQSREHIILKFSPLSMFDFDNTIQFGAEVPFRNNQFTIHQEVGYGHSSFNFWYKDFEDRPDKTTWKSRTQLRYYYFQKRNVRAYLAGEYLYKRVVKRDRQWVGMDCAQSGGCNYFQDRNVKIGRLANALHAKTGWQFYFSNRVTIDVFVGLGFRRIRAKMLTPGVPDTGFSGDWDLFDVVSPGSSELYPSMSAGFHLGYALGRFAK